MRFRGLLTALVAAAALVCGIPAAADVGSGSGPPTAIGTGGAAASVEKLATAGRDRHPAPRRERRRCSGRVGSRARSHRAVLVRNRRRRLHGHPHRRRRGHDDRRTGDGADGDASDVVLGERRALALQRRALQRSLGRRTRHGRDVGRRAREVRDDVAGRGLRAGDSRRASRLSSSTRCGSTR